MLPLFVLGMGCDRIVGKPAHYPELARLAWNRDPSRPISGEEALGLYEANWRHEEVNALTAEERRLIEMLAERLGGGHLLVSR